jgi:hypothetical protein
MFQCHLFVLDVEMHSRRLDDQELKSLTLVGAAAVNLQTADEDVHIG